MTAALDRGVAALRKEFAKELANGLITHLGTTNCRTKNNKPGGPWSEHAWPNAVDVMLKRIPGTQIPSPLARAAGDRVAKWMRAHPELWSEVFWQVAAHYDHVHGTAKPRQNYDNKQIPPCAGGTPGKDDLPMDAIKGIQRALNAAGYKGSGGKVLTVDGKWGANTEAAFTAMAKDATKTGGSTGITATQATAIAKAEINKSKNVAV